MTDNDKALALDAAAKVIYGRHGHGPADWAGRDYSVRLVYIEEARCVLAAYQAALPKGQESGLVERLRAGADTNNINANCLAEDAEPHNPNEPVYREKINELRGMAKDQRDAADAIETLTRERDEARLERHAIAEKYKFFADACEKAEAQLSTLRRDTVAECAKWLLARAESHYKNGTIIGKAGDTAGRSYHYGQRDWLQNTAEKMQSALSPSTEQETT